jgi:hypothetical protein
MGPKTPKSTVLTAAEEAVVVAFRQNGDDDDDDDDDEGLDGSRRPTYPPSRSATTRVLLSAREHRPWLIAASSAQSSSVVPVVGDATASSRSFGLLRRSARSETDGGNMRVLTINELLQMTWKELCDLAAHITLRLPIYHERITGPRRGTP